MSPNNAPYALIIPDARARFRYAHWGNMTEKHGMKYFTSEEKWHWPLNGGGIPEVWILTQCRAKKAKE